MMTRPITIFAICAAGALAAAPERVAYFSTGDKIPGTIDSRDETSVVVSSPVLAEPAIYGVGKRGNAVEEPLDGGLDSRPPANGRGRTEAEDRVVCQVTDERGPVLRVDGSEQAADIATGGAAGTH